MFHVIVSCVDSTTLKKTVITQLITLALYYDNFLKEKSLLHPVFIKDIKANSSILFIAEKIQQFQTS